MAHPYSSQQGQDAMQSGPEISRSGAAQVEIVPVQQPASCGNVDVSSEVEPTNEEALQGANEREELVNSAKEFLAHSSRKVSTGGWVDKGDEDAAHRDSPAILLDSQGRFSAVKESSSTTKEDLVEDYLRSTREKVSLSENQHPQQRRKSSMDASPVTRIHFERKMPILERRSYSAMLLAGVKAKIVRREPLAFIDTQDVSLSWLFGGLSKESWFRQQCYKLYTNRAWRVFNLVLIILNCAAVAVLPGLDDLQTIGGGSWTEHDWWKLFDLVCLFFLGLEIIVGIIALGFLSTNTSWFNCVEYHRLDMAVFVLASLENIATAFGLRTLTVIPFRLLRIFHVLTSAKPLSGVRVMLQTLVQGSTQLITVFATFLAITATFAIVGMAMFQRSFRRRCVLIDGLPPPWVPTATSLWGQGEVSYEEEVITGGHPFFQGCKIEYNSTEGAFDGSFPLDPYGRYHTCQLGGFKQGEPVTQTCEDVGNPDVSFGFGSFDSLGPAMLTLFQASLPDNFNIVLHVSLQAEPGTAWLTWLYYFLVTGISTSLMLGLFVAVVTGTFKRVREESDFRESQLRNLRLDANSIKLPASLRQPGLVISASRTSSVPVRAPAGVTAGLRRETSVGSVESVSGMCLAKPDEDAQSMRSHSATPDGGGIGIGIGMSMADAVRLASGGVARGEVAEARAGVGSEAEAKARVGSAGVLVDATLFASTTAAPQHADVGFTATHTVEQHGQMRRVVSSPGDATWKEQVSEWTAVPVFALNGFLYTVAIVHAATLASDQYNSSPEWKAVAGGIYIACSAVYALEVLVHAAAMHAADPHAVPRSKKLWFKAILCILGVVGWAADIEWLKRTQAMWMYKIMRLMPTLELLVSLTVASLEHVFSVCLFVCIWMMVYAVTGRYVFGDEMDAITRSNFGTMARAVLTVFQLFTGDSWSAVLYSALESANGEGNVIFHWIVAGLFILSWVVLSQFLLNNLFIAVIIDKFKVSEVISEQIRFNAEHSLLSRTRHHAASLWGKLNRRPNWNVKSLTHPGQTEADDLVRSFDSRGRSRRVADEASVGLDGEMIAQRGSSSIASRLRIAMLTGSQMQSSVALFNQILEYSDSNEMMSAVEHELCSLPSQLPAHEQAPERVLYLFRRENPARRFCVWLGQTKAFDAVVIVAIICSCLLLIITPKHDDIPGWDHWMSPADIRACSLGFTVLFTLEFLVRVMHQGLLLTPHAYLKSWWNQADLLILVFAWVDETGYIHSNGVSKVFRLGRAFRPMRLMKRNKGMRVLVDALLHALVPVSYVFLFSVFTSVVFGLVGMGIFGGRFYSCSAPGAAFPAGKRECVGLSVQEETGVLTPRAWVNDYHNFDTIWDACTTLLQVATLKYVGVMFRAMDVTELEQSPRPDATENAALFFVAFIVCGRLFVYNLFVAFIVDGFYASRGTSQSSVAFGRLMRQLKIHKPPREDYKMWSNRLSKQLRRVVQHRYFQTWSIVCVMINVLIMLTDHADPTAEFASFMWWQNLIFFLELCVEVLLQIIAYGPAAFVQDKWRVFDLAVAAGTATGYISSQREIANFAKSFRLARALRFMTLIRSVRIIFETLIACLPQLFNIFLLVVLVYSIFAAVAVQLFGVTKYGRRLGPTANFDTWSQAMQTCYQMLTGDDWMDLRSDCEVQPPYCTPTFDAANVVGWEGEDLSFGDCGAGTAYLYFIAFKIFCEAVLLNLVIGMALDNFSFVTDDVSHEEDATWSAGASSDQVRQLAVVFREFDAGTRAIPLSFLPSLMHKLPRPMGFTDNLLSPQGRRLNRRLSPRGSVEASAHTARSEGSQHSARQRLLSPQVSNDKAMLRNVRAELNCLWATHWLGWKQRFKEAVTFEEVMRTIVLWQLPGLVPDEVHAWRQRWVMDDIMDMKRILAVRDWLVLRHRYKRKAREAREQHQQAVEVERERQQTEAVELAKLAEDGVRVDSEAVQSKRSMPATVASQTDTPRQHGGSSRQGSESEQKVPS